MPLDLGTMRYAHCEGYTDVCYDNDGRYLITCGSDGDVRIYDGFDDDDPKSFRAGEEVTAVAFQDNRILAGADCAVKIYTFPEGTPDGMITRFPATINSLCCSKSGNYLAAGASDFNIKVVEVQNSSHKLLKGHEAPILCVAMDQNEEFLVSSSCDGTVKIWNWKEQKCLRSLSLLQKSNDFSVAKSLCKLEFQPKENGCLAIPVAKEIKIYEKETWKLLYVLKVDDSGSGSQSVSIVKWSPCGNYLASATINGEFLIWSIKTKQVVERAQHEKSLPITSLVWNPTKNGEIAYTDNQGQLGLCTDVIPSDSTVQKTNVFDPLNAMANEFIDDDDNRSETESLLGVKNRGRLKKSWLDDEADEDDDYDDNITDLGKIKAELAGPLGLDVDDDMTLADSMKNVTETNIDNKPIVFQQPQTFQQQPFQPGSTPVHLMHRFMVWNHVGIVRSHSEEEPASIDVEFHDSNLHHSMNLINELNHTMAAISNQAVLLACQANDEIPSKLVCLHFGTWDRSKEWSVAMPQGEDIMAIAVGSSWAAAITNQDLLRVFTIGGLQKALISVPGPVVCMSGFGTQLIVVYHNGVGVAGSQCLAVKLIDLETNTQVLCDQRLPLSPKANLSWLGFSLEGTPSTVDSLGVVRLLNRSLGNTWINVANTKTEVKRSSDNYWVVGITETSQQIRCVLCTGSTYPPTLPRPLISSLSLKLPVCEVDTEKGQLEENYLRWRLLMNRYDHESERGVVIEDELYEQNKTQVKQLLMKIFALSCKTERDFRAREVCELLPDAYSVSLAIKYASRNRRMNLAQRLDEVALHKAEEEAANQHEQFDDMYNIKEETGRRSSDLFERENRTQRNHVVEEYEDDTKNDEKCNESFESPLQVSTTPKASRCSLSKRLPNFHHRFYHQDTPQRCNPFKVNKEKSTANDSSISFFENVENDRQIAKTLDKKSPTESTKSKASKQIKLFSKKKRNDNKQESKVDEVKISTKPTEKAITTKPKKNAFQCWLDVMKPFFADENPEMSEGEIMKIAVKQWRETPKEEKQVWERNSASAPSMNIMCQSQEHAEDVTGAGGKKINEFESEVNEMQHESEIDEKKRKRNEDGNERIIGDISDEKENISKKVKTFDKQKVNSKLSTFSFTK